MYEKLGQIMKIENAGQMLAKILVKSCQKYWSEAVNNAGRKLSKMLVESCQKYWSEAARMLVENASQKLSRTLIRS